MRMAMAVTWLLHLLLMASQLAAVPARADERVQSVLAHLQATRVSDPTWGFTQRIDMRFLIKHWRFSAQIDHTAAGTTVQLVGAPGLVPESVPREVADFTADVNQYDLTYDEQGSDAQYAVLRGRRKPTATTGATSVVVWVNRSSWHIDKAQAGYSWGTLSLAQTYAPRDGRTVLDHQVVDIAPLPVHLEISYDQYWFGRKAGAAS